MNSLQDLFVEQLQDLYDAEHQLVKALPKVAAAAASPGLREAIQEHLEQTRGHVERLEQIFEDIGQPARASHCDGMAGLIKEGGKILQKNGQEFVIDAGIIAAAQRIEHYEIAGYGCACTFAKRLGHNDAADLLAETLEEEKQADQMLTEIAEEEVNSKAGASQQG